MQRIYIDFDVRKPKPFMAPGTGSGIKRPKVLFGRDGGEGLGPQDPGCHQPTRPDS